MVVRHGLSNLSDKLPYVQRVLETFDLLHDGQALFAPCADHRERSAAAGPQDRMALLDGPLDILGVVISSSDNDEIFQATSDIQLTIFDKSQIAGP